MENFTIVHPNNKLTKIDNLTIANLEKYLISISKQLKKLTTVESDNVATHQKASLSNSPPYPNPDVDTNRIHRLKEFKKSEWKYIKSYLTILKSLESVCKTCSRTDDGSIRCATGDNYDFEKEDEILNQIEDEMKHFRKLELELAEKKEIYETDGKILDNTHHHQLNERQRRDSLVKLEQDLVENVEHIKIK